MTPEFKKYLFDKMVEIAHKRHPGEKLTACMTENEELSIENSLTKEGDNIYLWYNTDDHSTRIVKVEFKKVKFEGSKLSV